MKKKRDNSNSVPCSAFVRDNTHTHTNLNETLVTQDLNFKGIYPRICGILVYPFLTLMVNGSKKHHRLILLGIVLRIGGSYARKWGKTGVIKLPSFMGIK